MYDEEVNTTLRTLEQIRGICDEMHNVKPGPFLESQGTYWHDLVWSDVSSIRMVFGHRVAEKAVRAADARALRDGGARLPAGVRAFLRQHDGIMLAAFNDDHKLLGTMELCTMRMMESEAVGDFGLIPVFWDYDDVPSSTIVHAVHATSGMVVAFEPPTFRRSPELHLIATSFSEWLDTFVLRCHAIPHRMPVIRTLRVDGAPRRRNTGVGLGPYESDVLH